MEKLFSIEKLEDYIDRRLINVQKHPTEDLYIYNYSKAAQYDQLWDEITVNCRGLITDGNRKIVARPFPKFFNWEQHTPEEIPDLPYRIFDKMDGCLGVLYWVEDEPFIATRGSFASVQSAAANEILRDNIELFEAAKKFDKDLTYCFEIIHPSYRIVVDYEGRKDLVLLGIIETATGKDVEIPETPFTTVREYHGVEDFKVLQDQNLENQEGFIVVYENGFRIKIKFEEYCRLHSILTNVSTKTIWKCLRAGTDFTDLLEEVPDEFYNWVEKKKSGLLEKYDEVEAEGHKELQIIANKFPEYSFDDFAIGGEMRKEFAQEVFANCGKKSLVFAILDGKQYSDRIWKTIEPEFETPFLSNEEE